MASNTTNSETPTEAVLRAEVDRVRGRLESRMATVRELAALRQADIDTSDPSRTMFDLIVFIGRTELAMELVLEGQEDVITALLELNQLKLRDIRTERKRLAEAAESRDERRVVFKSVFDTLRAGMESPRAVGVAVTVLSSGFWAAAAWIYQHWGG